MRSEKKSKNNHQDDDIPQIYALKREKGGWSLNRRDFLKAAAAGGAAAVMLACGNKERGGAASICSDGLRAHSQAVAILSISPDGRFLASASRAGERSIKLWSLPDGALIRTLKGHRDDVTSAAFSPDGNILAASGGSNDQSVKLWSLPEGDLLRTLAGHTDYIGCVTFSPDGQILASSGAGQLDNTIKLWSPADGSLLTTCIGHADKVNSLSISPDGRMLASGSDDGIIKIWSLPDGALIQTLTEQFIAGWSVALDSEKCLLVSVNRGIDAILLYSQPDGVMLRTLAVGAFTHLAVSNDGRSLAYRHWDGSIKLWSLPDAILMRALASDGDNDRADAFIFSPDGDLILINCQADSTIKLWSLSSGVLSGSLAVTQHNQLFSCVSMAVSRDGRLCALGGVMGAIQLWSLPDGAFQSCLIDVAACESSVEIIQYRIVNQRNENISAYMPGGVPVPEGAVCVCNTVRGSYALPSSEDSGGGSGGGHYWFSN